VRLREFAECNADEKIANKAAVLQAATVGHHAWHVPYTQAAVERATKVQEVILRAQAQ
jgi:hypothetical protein